MEELLSRLKVRLRFSGTVEDAVLSDHLQTAVDVVNDIRQYTPYLDAVVGTAVPECGGGNGVGRLQQDGCRRTELPCRKWS